MQAGALENNVSVAHGEALVFRIKAAQTFMMPEPDKTILIA